ncbi:hypothetical protein GCM10025858_01910 [Alicyclobacillus sacchari]|nr:hypothetical protein GCM10025858_01910 [Alicyclobacillus sacchari]
MCQSEQTAQGWRLEHTDRDRAKHKQRIGRVREGKQPLPFNSCALVRLTEAGGDHGVHRVTRG